MSTIENLDSERRVHVFAPVAPEQEPSLAKVHALMAVAWRESADYWREIARAAVAELDFHLAIFAGNNAAERDVWADEDAAAATRYLLLEGQQ